MQLYHDGQVVDCWEISKSDKQPPDWVVQAFQKNIMVWVDNRLRILMPALYSNWAQDSRYLGYGMYVFGEIGDVIDRTNGIVMTAKRYRESYKEKESQENNI